MSDAKAAPAAIPDTPEDPEARSKRLTGVAFWAVFVLTLAGLALSINQIFNLGLGGFRPVATAYYYLVIGLFGAAGYLAFPARKADRTVGSAAPLNGAVAGTWQELAKVLGKSQSERWVSLGQTAGF